MNDWWIDGGSMVGMRWLGGVGSARRDWGLDWACVGMFSASGTNKCQGRRFVDS
ncbi:hypothetical protein MTX37_31610 [Rhodococcus sp. ARC_M8]|nr:hypothetical protein N601_29850 [Rhodococcus erythropolis DN1]MCJ0950462.1 hypothetical protein [Rhodococcus sp. ARC_M8]